MTICRFYPTDIQRVEMMMKSRQYGLVRDLRGLYVVIRAVLCGTSDDRGFSAFPVSVVQAPADDHSSSSTEAAGPPQPAVTAQQRAAAARTAPQVQ